MKTAQQENNGELDRNEWCFENVEPGELGACYIYEYSRELARRPHIISETRNYNGNAATDEEFRSRFLKLIPSPIGDLVFAKYGASNVSWQEVDRKARSQCVTILT